MIWIMLIPRQRMEMYKRDRNVGAESEEVGSLRQNDGTDGKGNFLAFAARCHEESLAGWD